MAKHAAKEFCERLHVLFDTRTIWLQKAVLLRNIGRPPALNSKKVNHEIIALQELASQVLASRLAKKEFANTIDEHKQWRVSNYKGWGWQAKRQNFSDWFQSRIPYPNCIYVFWAKKRCRYVGRTVCGKGRPQAHFEKSWFGGVTRIDVYSTSSASQVAKLECLAIHRFHPRENGVRASIPKWAKKCPVCEIHKDIKREIRMIFRLKR